MVLEYLCIVIHLFTVYGFIIEKARSSVHAPSMPMGRNGAAKPKFPRAPDCPRGPRLCIAAGHGSQSHQVEINQSNNQADRRRLCRLLLRASLRPSLHLSVSDTQCLSVREQRLSPSRLVAHTYTVTPSPRLTLSDFPQSQRRPQRASAPRQRPTLSSHSLGAQSGIHSTFTIHVNDHDLRYDSNQSVAYKMRIIRFK